MGRAKHFRFDIAKARCVDSIYRSLGYDIQPQAKHNSQNSGLKSVTVWRVDGNSLPARLTKSQPKNETREANEDAKRTGYDQQNPQNNLERDTKIRQNPVFIFLFFIDIRDIHQ